MRNDLIETSHGTVCPRCLLWPDTCTCRHDHPARLILAAAFHYEPDVLTLLREPTPKT